MYWPKNSLEECAVFEKMEQKCRSAGQTPKATDETKSDPATLPNWNKSSKWINSHVRCHVTYNGEKFINLPIDASAQTIATRVGMSMIVQMMIPLNDKRLAKKDERNKILLRKRLKPGLNKNCESRDKITYRRSYSHSDQDDDLVHQQNRSVK